MPLPAPVTTAILDASTLTGSTTGGPVHPVGAGAGRDVAGNFERFQIHDGDPVVVGRGHIDARTVGRHQGPRYAAADVQMLDVLTGSYIDDDQIAAGKVRDQRALSVGREL